MKSHRKFGLSASIASRQGILALLTLSAVLLGNTLQSQDNGNAATAWRLAAKLLVNDALRSLPATETGRPQRVVALTRAILLCGAQPKTQGNLAEAARLLKEVRATDPGDELGRQALFYLGRLAQIHQNPPDPVQAAAAFEELYRLAPTDPFGQAAAVQWTLLRLFELDPAPDAASNLAPLREAEALVATLTAPAARRDLHLALAEYRRLLNPADKPSILDHLLAAEAAGIQQPVLAATVALRIGELARTAGRMDLALDHYRQFLALQPHDPRRDMVRQHLEELVVASRP